MAQVTLTADGLSKTFNRRRIFSGISFGLQSGSSLAITGRNGSGKSTLVKILCGVLTPTRGNVGMTLDGKTVPAADRFTLIGLVSPYLQLYDEFTGWENLRLSARIRGLAVRDEEITGLLERVALADRRNDYVRTYSSGMKQRLKYAFALLHRPPILVLDEPASNLDVDGVEIIRTMMTEQRRHGILIVATNDADDLGYCETVVDLNAPAGGKS